MGDIKVYNVGIVGEGKYKATIDGYITKHYQYWHGILRRGFDQKWLSKHPTYKDVIINDDVLDFQKFGKWLDDNWYEVDNDVMCIDKDILVKGNKEYRFDRMILVPHRINALFTKRDSERGDLPVGVYYNKTKNKYVAQCNIIDSNGSRKRKHLGYYDNSYNAFLAYKQFKEQYIKQVADEYKDKIPDKLYKAMYSWEVEITD